MGRLAFAVCFLAIAAPAGAQQPERADPDWPCVQRKVPTLTPAAIWTRPPIDGSSDWASDPRIRELVTRLSQRRVPLEEADAEIAAFAEALPAEERAEHLTALFAGLFQTMNAERSEIIAGIERYARRQKALAEDIREQAAALAEMSSGSANAADQELQFKRRVFEERRQSQAFICELPRLVEQRLFALGRAVGVAMPE